MLLRTGFGSPSNALGSMVNRWASSTIRLPRCLRGRQHNYYLYLFYFIFFLFFFYFFLWCVWVLPRTLPPRGDIAEGKVLPPDAPPRGMSRWARYFLRTLPRGGCRGGQGHPPDAPPRGMSRGVLAAHRQYF